ncbi:MAG: thiamine pyrophosphate-dependent dehydrogenase E1 component subunit alpha [Actinobacteria bacterium]|nr:MAG: thiamine pyrophosphate-dependent dehydrogenase E1 component subunit alpha [Actinomycetota bacterium]
MLRIRIVEERIGEVYPAGEMRTPTHFCIGQEATPVGVCDVLRPDDVLHFSHRTHGWYLAKGGDLDAMVAEFFGRATGCAKGWGGSMHLIDLDVGLMGSSSILGGTIGHAVGSALAFKMRGEQRVAVAAFGDAAVEEGIFAESVNWAVITRAPVVFVCENNLYSSQSPLHVRQPDIPIHERVEGFGIPATRVDGNDVVAVRSAAAEAVERGRAGGGPSFIEALTYRWRGHVGPEEDDHLGYRSVAEVDEWKARCPVDRLTPLVPAELREELALRFLRETDAALRFASASPAPTWEDAWREV